MSIALMAVMRDEGPWLLDWVAHHKALGIERIVIGANKCEDGTDKILARLEEMGEVRWLNLHPHYLPRPEKICGYARLRCQAEVATADWLIALDADERLEVEGGSLEAYLASLPAEADAIALPRHRTAPGASAFERGPRLARASFDGHKIVTRAHLSFPLWGAPGPLLPSETPKAERFDVPLVDATGRPLNPKTLGWGLEIEPTAPGPAWIDHAAARSIEHFALKCLRGDPMLFPPGRPKKATRDHWTARAKPGSPAPRSAALAALRAETLATWRADPDLAGLEREATLHWETTLARARDDPKTSKFLTRLGWAGDLRARLRGKG